MTAQEPLAGLPEEERPALAALLAVSDLALPHLRSHPGALARLIALRDDERSPAARIEPLAALPPDWPGLRRIRREESLRLAWRDALGRDPLERTLAETSELAEAVIRVGLAWLEAEAGGGAPPLAVLALGKLGGRELNFSSDVDLVLVGEADEPGLQRRARRLARALAEADHEGFLYRVDLRLRPFGEAGPPVIGLAALEQYFLREAREWERFAWIRARAVAGDPALGEAALGLARSFVFRRYLDYEALAALRRTKAALAAEVGRRGLEEDLKRGPGGIRELEFVVQALQLVRGGREPELRAPAILAALPALAARRVLPPERAQALERAYRLLRRVENRVQMLSEAQTHRLPADAATRLRVARGLGFADAAALEAAIAAARAAVRESFLALFPGPSAPRPESEEARRWARLAAEPPPPRSVPRPPPIPGSRPSPPCCAGLPRAASRPGRASGSTGSARACSPRSSAAGPRRARRRRWPSCSRCCSAAAPISRCSTSIRRPASVWWRWSPRPRSSAASSSRSRCCSTACSRRRHRPRSGSRPWPGASPPPPAMAEACLRLLAELKGESQLELGLALLEGRTGAIDCAAGLSRLAERLLERLFALAAAELAARHGRLRAEGLPLAVVGYGSLGALELGFRSDLDLVFLCDPEALAASSDGPRPLPAAGYLVRLIQRGLAYLASPGGSGPLYEVDVRLRPEGAKGLPLVTLAGFARYQRERARLWEHQALLRARPLFGAPEALASFAALRAEALGQARDPARVRAELAALRERLRAERDRSDGERFDLKQGRGGLVDLAFLLEAKLLLDPEAALAAGTGTAAWIAALGARGALEEPEALRAAHARLLDLALRCHLRLAPRIVPRATPGLEEARAAIQRAWRAAGLPQSP
ncbi:MAG: glutamine-synthetase adenylyltransferase [Xanthomonadales bacterium]|nr:glutamine-synthetase adenylyltransferase [Xanthomonadales bacterium]